MQLIFSKLTEKSIIHFSTNVVARLDTGTDFRFLYFFCATPIELPLVILVETVNFHLFTLLYECLKNCSLSSL